MPTPLAKLRALAPESRLKAAFLSTWFFLTITTLWLLKAVRTGSLLAHVGAKDTPWVRFASVAAVAVVVFVYTRAVNRLSRLSVARGAGLLFALVLAGFWLAMRLGGEAVAGNRAFVWSVYVLVDIYSTVAVGIFWTYANDVVSTEEANVLYGPIGLGGIVGGVAGGVLVDVLAKVIGPVDLVLLAAGLSLACAALAQVSEAKLKPKPRAIEEEREGGLSAALAGVREVLRSRYLLLLVGIVVTYEFAATLTDFAINVVFERSFQGQAEIAKMYGRLGWIASGTAIVSQAVIVPLVLPHKRVALLLPPLVMAGASVGLIVAPVVAMSMVLAASDRGFNYSVQQATKETLYVPLTDAQKYKAKALIDMLIDRAAKAGAAVALVVIIARVGLSVRVSVALALFALAVWAIFADALGREYARHERAEPTGADAKPAPQPRRATPEAPAHP